jgi:hypothetical protein
MTDEVFKCIHWNILVKPKFLRGANRRSKKRGDVDSEEAQILETNRG